MKTAKSPAPRQRLGTRQGRRPIGRKKIAQDVLSRRTSLASLYRVDPLQRIKMVKEGVPARMLSLLSKELAIPKDKLYTTIGLKRASMNRKLRSQQKLSQDQSERVVEMARLVGQVLAMVEESGRPEGFDAARWVAAWLERPHPALGDQRPAALMDTAEGRAIVSDLIARIQSGAYA